ncbi:hypothetical protein [Kibdelosporangium phytohabitans]|uniref:Uncharacterized protein n=1 Tax=Kibdelosporangium phytohabitans TaxID=860235 RepID=A0A0N9I1H5_9PSEU|nr:hypothetical protein [Kibdelosporangium phytohabitans]ALG08278.1 hypothetical protein AOZ06_16405 [Kibdelosporangium phytohabitans]MBE1470699.1 hypothetical protein [Kibdelosporangium phytohabitans]
MWKTTVDDVGDRSDEDEQEADPAPDQQYCPSFAEYPCHLSYLGQEQASAAAQAHPFNRYGSLHEN